MIRMKVRIDGLDELEIEILQKLNVAIDLLEHRIDDGVPLRRGGSRADKYRCTMYYRTAGERSWSSPLGTIGPIRPRHNTPLAAQLVTRLPSYPYFYEFGTSLQGHTAN